MVRASDGRCAVDIRGFTLFDSKGKASEMHRDVQSRRQTIFGRY